MKHCPSDDCPYRERHGERAGYRGDATTCSDCGSTLVEGDPEPVPPAATTGTTPVGRLAVTLAAPLALAALATVTLPQLDGRTMAAMQRDFGVAGWVATTKFSVVALGIVPLVNGMLLTEWAALLVPRWRPLRNGTPEDRARLRRAAFGAALACALLQGYGIAVWLESLTTIGGGYAGPSLITSPGAGSRVSIALLLTLGSAVAAALAHAIHRHGLGNGVSVLLLAGTAPATASAWLTIRAVSSSAQSSTPVLATLAGAGAVVACTWAVLTQAWRRAPTPEPDIVRHPACGVIPVESAPHVLSLVGLTGALAPGSDGIAVAVLAGLAAVLCAVLFNRPDLIAAQYVRLGAADEAAITARVARDLVRGAAIGLAFVIALLVVPRLIGRYGALALGSVALATGTAIVMDLAGEWRMRTRHPRLAVAWELHRVWCVDPAVRLLAQDGIDAYPRGVNHRAMLHFFGPFVPIELLVPETDAARARDVLERAFGPKAT